MEAIILHRAPFGEADRILEMMTREAGKISVIAKHAGKSRRRFGQVLDYFNLLEVSARQGRGGLAFLEEASLVRGYPALRDQWERLGQAYEFLEMIRAMVREGQPEPAKFELLLETIDLVAGAKAGRFLKPAFQLRLLVLAGVGPNFAVCSECGKRPGQETIAGWMLIWGRGGLMCGDCCRHLEVGEGGLAVSPPALVWMEQASRIGPAVLQPASVPPDEVMMAADRCWQYFS